MSTEATLQVIAEELVGVLAPLRSLSSEKRRLALVAQLGWDLPPSVQDISALQADLSGLIGAIQAAHELTLDERRDEQRVVEAYVKILIEAAALVSAVVSSIKSIQAGGGFTQGYLDSSRLIEELPERLIAFLVFEYIHRKHFAIAAILRFLGILEVEEAPADPSIHQVEHLRHSIRLDRLGMFLNGTGPWAEEVYGWGSATYRPGKLLQSLSMVLMAIGISRRIRALPRAAEERLVGTQAPEADTHPMTQVIVPMYRIIDQVRGEAGISLIGLRPTTAGGDGGLALFPYAFGQAKLEFQLPGFANWSALLGLGGESEVVPIATVRPGSEVQLISNRSHRTLPFSAGVEIGARYAATSEKPGQLLSLPGGTSLTVERASIRAGLELDRDGNVVPSATLALENLSLKIGLAQADSFVSMSARSSSIDALLDFGILWSDGQVTLSGGGALAADIPVHAALGPLLIQIFHLSFVFDEARLEMSLGLSVGCELGPIAASIERIGAKGAWMFSRERPEEASLDVGFLPPTGAGLAIDAGAIAGGGYLKFDPPNKSYTGILQLQAGGIGLVAIGLITTRMPDGSDGFSLLINIGVEFLPPITLPYGFTLSGVGGLLGYNRTMNVEALREGLRNRALDSILFPEDPIANAPKIISDLRSVFPAEEGRFVIGPMIKLGWGVPVNIIQADIGIFIEMPLPIRIAVLGQLAAGLPNFDNAIIELHIDVLGIIEFEKRQLSIDATIYDSRIYQYTLTGDAAVRLDWGDNPVLAMSLGGFHPRFSPPAGFPNLGRLTLNLSQGSNLQLYCKAYQALTSNSLQFGALVDLYAKQSGATVEGNLSFDALMYFSPFSFAVVLAGNVLAKYKDHQLANVRINMQLSGPTPWNARGRASFEILLWEPSVKFNKSWGPQAPLVIAAVDPWLDLKEALEQNESWGARLPGSSSVVEMLVSIEAGDNSDTVLVHPAGMLEVRQTVLPLKMTLQKFGNAPVKDRTTFEVTSMTIAGDTLEPVDLEEDFARAQFLRLSDNERLTLPSFEKMPAGVAVGSDAIAFNAGKVKPMDHAFESILIKADRTSVKAAPPFPSPSPSPSPSPTEAILPWATASRHLHGCAARRCGLRTTARRRYETLGKARQVSVLTEGYQIVDTDDLKPVVNIPGNDGSLGRLHAEQALAAYRAANPAMATRLELAPTHEVTT